MTILHKSNKIITINNKTYKMKMKINLKMFLNNLKIQIINNLLNNKETNNLIIKINSDCELDYYNS